MFLIKILLILILNEFFSDLRVPIYPAKAAVIRNLSPNENYLESQNANKRNVERDHLKSYRIVAEHIGPSESPSNGERNRNPKYDSVEFEEKNVDIVEEVVTTLDEVGTIDPEGENSRGHVGDFQSSSSYPTFENLKEQSKSEVDSVGVDLEDPAFRNRRSKYSGILFKRLNSGDDFGEISYQYPRIGSIHEKDLQKRFSYEIDDFFNKSSPYKTSRDTTTEMNFMVQERKDNLTSPQDYRNTSSDSKEPIKPQSHNLEALTSASHNLNHRQSLNNLITPQPDMEIPSHFRNDTKRTSPSGSSGKKTKYIDLNDPKLNFSYEGKPGDDIVLRIDRQGPQLNNQSERMKKDDKTSQLGGPSSTNIKEIGKKVEVFEETIISSGDNDTLNISNVIPNNEEDVLKIAIPLMKLDKDSGGRVKWNVREDTGGSKYFEIGNQPEIRDDVVYVMDKNRREVVCDSFMLQLFKSNIFVATLIFVLIVAVVILFLILIYNMGMRSVSRKHKYKKVSTDDFAHDGPPGQASSKSSRPLLGYMKILSSAESIKRLIGIRTLSSEDDNKSTTESEKENKKKFQDDNKGTRGGELGRGKYTASTTSKRGKEDKVDEHKTQQKQDQKQKSQSRKLSIDKRKHGKDLKDNERKQKSLTRKISFQEPEEGNEDNRSRTLKEQRSKSHARDVSFQRTKEAKAAVEKYRTSKVKDNSKRYSTHLYQSKADGPILSYERIQKNKPKYSSSSVECPCVETDSNTGVVDKAMTSPNGNTDKISTTNKANRKSKVIDWMKRTFTSESQTSSDDEVQDKVKRSNGKSSNESSMGTKIKDMILGQTPQQEGNKQTTEESDSDKEKLKKVVRGKKKKTIKKKRDIQVKNSKIELESVLSDADFSSGASPPPKPKELINKIVTTGECKRIDDMLTGRGWQRSFYYGQGIKTLDSGHESFDHQPGVKDNADLNGMGSEVKTAMKNSSSSQALQDEIGKLINVAENNIKQVEPKPTYDLQNK